MQPKVAQSSEIGGLLLLVSLLSSCSDCQLVVDAERRSPDNQFVAASYSRSCGPVAPFDYRIGLRTTSEQNYRDIVTILDAPFEASADWENARVLVVTFHCPRDTNAGCAPPTERAWSVRGPKDWGDVRIRYLLSPQLRSMLTPDQLARFPT